MRRCRIWTIIIAALVFAGTGFGQDYPSRVITLIVPYAAGGGVDVVARVIGQTLAERLGQKIVVENVTGAGGVIGTQRVARAQPDGYTLLFAVENTMAVAKLVQPSVVQYDSQKDFAPISLIGTAPLVLLGKKDLPANNISELMKLLRANPGKYSYASSGVGTSLQVLGEMINVEGKVHMVHVPYRAAPQIVADLVSNQIDLAVLPLNLALALPRRLREDFRHERARALPARARPAEPGGQSGAQGRRHDRLVRAVRARQDRSCDCRADLQRPCGDAARS
jgi:tripartite-type tricarboxylate transporter receptor subunit TctC